MKKVQALSLNDLVVTRGGISRILNLDLFIDHVLVEKLPGDGVIISTPTGSTAYSLSAGGPIIEPTLEIILITPLNPHTLHNRSYVVAPDSHVEIIIKEYPFNPLLTSDGVHICTLDELDRIVVTKSSTSMNLIKLKKGNFYESLTTKDICKRDLNILREYSWRRKLMKVSKKERHNYILSHYQQAGCLHTGRTGGDPQGTPS